MEHIGDERKSSYGQRGSIGHARAGRAGQGGVLAARRGQSGGRGGLVSRLVAGAGIRCLGRTDCLRPGSGLGRLEESCYGGDVGPEARC